jgi:hypothetical protein
VVVVVLALAAAIVAMLVAFALPSVHSGPHQVPVGVTLNATKSQADVEASLRGDAWHVEHFEDAAALQASIDSRDIMGGIVLAPGGVIAYTASADGTQAATALTSVAQSIADKHETHLSVTDVKPFTSHDPKGSGFSSIALPIVFGGMFPAVILTRIFPGHAGLRRRLAAGLGFAVVTGFALTAFLQYGTQSLDGAFVVNSVGVSLGIAALVLTLLGLEALLGLGGFGLGAAAVMLVANPLSAISTGPHWLPNGWSTLGQLLPPGATGSLLRANAFFDGTGARTPALVLAGWTVAGLVMVLAADRRGPRRARPRGAAPASAV